MMYLLYCNLFRIFRRADDFPAQTMCARRSVSFQGWVLELVEFKNTPKSEQFDVH